MFVQRRIDGYQVSGLSGRPIRETDNTIEKVFSPFFDVYGTDFWDDDNGRRGKLMNSLTFEIRISRRQRRDVLSCCYLFKHGGGRKNDLVVKLLASSSSRAKNAVAAAVDFFAKIRWSTALDGSSIFFPFGFCGEAN